MPSLTAFICCSGWALAVCAHIPFPEHSVSGSLRPAYPAGSFLVLGQHSPRHACIPSVSTVCLGFVWVGQMDWDEAQMGVEVCLFFPFFFLFILDYNGFERVSLFCIKCICITVFYSPEDAQQCVSLLETTVWKHCLSTLLSRGKGQCPQTLQPPGASRLHHTGLRCRLSLAFPSLWVQHGVRQTIAEKHRLWL